MHCSQLKKQDLAKRNVHPGTPRPTFRDLPETQDEMSTVTKNAVKHLRSKMRTLSSTTTCQAPQDNNTNTIISPSGENLPDILIWVKNEPFDFGIVSPFPCPKIGINILRKVADYCREKPGHYPELSFNQWNHICKYKIQLTGDLTLTYFRVFDILTRPACMWTPTSQGNGDQPRNEDSQEKDSDENDQDGILDGNWDTKFQRIAKLGYDSSDELKVDTLQFLLFLYIQHFMRLHKKYLLSRSYSQDEPWPKFWPNSTNDQSQRSNMKSQRTGGGGSISTVPEQLQAEFLTANLGDMIDFLMLLRRRGGIKNQNDTVTSDEVEQEKPECTDRRVSTDVVKALSFILGAASTNLDREFRTLEECLVLEEVSARLDYRKSTNTVSKHRLMHWITKNLKLNPWGPSSVPIPQVPVFIMTGVWEEAECFKQNRIYWNTQCYPKAWFLISGVEKQVLLFDSTEAMSSIKIHRCIDAHLYVPCVHTMVLIQKCHGVTINIGVATKVVKIVDCSNITVTGVGRLFIICDVTKSTFHLLTPCSPILCGTRNQEINFAPYNTYYPTLSIHMKMAGLSADVQKWSKPLEIGSDGIPQQAKIQTSNNNNNCSLLRPEQFIITFYPFKSLGSRSGACSLPGSIPSAYQRKLDHITETTENVRKEFARLMVSEEDTNLLYQCTLQRFKKWLKESGNFAQIVGLRSFQKSIEQKSQSPIVCSKGHDLSCISRAVRTFLNSTLSTAIKTQCDISGDDQDFDLEGKNYLEKTKDRRPFFQPSSIQASGGGENPEGILM
ncbi:TBCC domain-containing protein 1 [Orchesella cincta]|uniref:TBCC domain-containing protein 1 n=1 Tax=Orchesella cincta TaxID=48709 RepID=A0A1D2MY44_ORCCI|nr:TBCC domain-containing protein 1 [Orchesella cincta]